MLIQNKYWRNGSNVKTTLLKHKESLFKGKKNKSDKVSKRDANYGPKMCGMRTVIVNPPAIPYTLQDSLVLPDSPHA